MGLRKFLSLPVVVVFVLFGFIYYIVVFLALDPWIGLYTANGMLNAGMFTAWVVMALVAYACAVLRDPGTVPPGWMREPEDDDFLIQEVKKKSGEARFCQKCRHYKPPRAHHCRICQRCVLRMDHHCVWINNCVGHRNYKSFFLFVLYVVTGCAHGLVLLGGHVMHELGWSPYQDDSGRGGPDEAVTTRFLQAAAASPALVAVLKILGLTVTIPLLLALGILLGWHVYLLSHNKTTIEHHEGVRAKWIARTTGEDYRHPYDLGIFSNLHVVLGPHASCWFCPLAVSYIGSGLKFDIAKGSYREEAMEDDRDCRATPTMRESTRSRQGDLQFKGMGEESLAWEGPDLPA